MTRPDAAPDWLTPLVMEARYGRVPALRPIYPRADGAPEPTPAGVLVALADPGQILLTHRQPSMRSHSGQVAFPGGRADPGDADILATALRETWEETGIAAEELTPLAVLPSGEIPVSGHIVTPVLAHWTAPRPLDVVNDEVARAWSVSLADLADPARRFRVTVGEFTGAAFSIDGYLVWGYTAFVIDQILTAGGWARPWNTDDVRDLGTELDRSANGGRR